MSHTFKGESCTIHHNGDYDGEAQIVPLDGPYVVVNVEDLLHFVAEFIRLQKITELELVCWRDFLGK